MASQHDPRKPAPQPQNPRKLHADKTAQDKAKTPAPKKDVPVVFQDWASI
ncbi:hypothetical protein [Aliiroseovarius sp.]